MVNTRFWVDDYVSNLDPTEKLIFLYFITSPYTEICGIYEVPLKHVAMETGIDRDMLSKIMARFEREGKMFYRDGWVAIRNFAKHQLDNPKVKRGIEIGLSKAPESLKKILNDSLSIDYRSLSHLNPNSNLNPNLNSNSKERPASEEKEEKVPFEDFWSVYPKKNDKKKCEEKWARITNDNRKKAIADVPLRKLGRKWIEGFTENPLTYLNGERWNDEIERPKVQGGHIASLKASSDKYKSYDTAGGK